MRRKIFTSMDGVRAYLRERATICEEAGKSTETWIYTKLLGLATTDDLAKLQIILYKLARTSESAVERTICNFVAHAIREEKTN
jgi:hypothetical protein